MIKKFQIRKGYNRGFTLVELLIYIGLLGMFLVVLLDIFVMTLNTKLESESSSALAQDSRYVLSKLNYEIMNADSIEIPASGTTGTTLRIVNSGTAKTFASSSGSLVLTAGGQTLSLTGLDTNLIGLSFQNTSAVGGKPTIKFSFTLESNINVNNDNDSQTISSSVSVRQ